MHGFNTAFRWRNNITSTDSGFNITTNEIDRWNHFGSGSWARASDADAQNYEDQVDTSGADWYDLIVYQANTALGDLTVFRALTDISCDDDSNGSFINWARTATSGSLRVVGRGDAGTDVIPQSPLPVTTELVFDGGLYFIQLSDTAATTSGVVKAKVNGGSLQTLVTGYARGNIGVLDIWGLFGLGRGPGNPPETISSPLGWGYMRVRVNQDMEAHMANIYSAYNNILKNSPKSNLYLACRAAYSAIRSSVSNVANIRVAKIFRRNEAQIAGGAITLNGTVAYTEYNTQP